MQALTGKFALIDNKFKPILLQSKILRKSSKSPYLQEYEFLLAETKEELAHDERGA